MPVERHIDLHIALPEEHFHNSKNTTFQQRGKTTGRGDAIASKEQRHFSPLVAILEKKACDAIPLGRYGFRHTSCGHNSK
jgi:hypothetical protein